NKGSPWRFVIEGTIKRNKGILTPATYELRSGLGYEWKPDHEVSVGYTLEDHIPYDSASQPYQWLEDRIWEDVKFPIGRKVKQEIRLEQRWEARKSAPDYDDVTHYNYETTLRYQFRLVFPLNAKTGSIFYDEVHVRLSPTNEKFFDQNRLFAGFGFKLE